MLLALVLAFGDPQQVRPVASWAVFANTALASDAIAMLEKLLAECPCCRGAPFEGLKVKILAFFK